MKFLRVCLPVAVMLLSASSPAYAPIRAIGDFGGLFDQSDLAVIARPASRTMDTREKSYFDFVLQDEHGKQLKVPSIGVETFFEVSKVLKGDETLKRFILHHYRRVSRTPAFIGREGGISFDPTDLSKGKDFLLFLKKEKDGRYAPLAGQDDPGGQSIFVIGSPS